MTRKAKAKPKRKVKVDKACQCQPVRLATFPIGRHSVNCPVRRRYTNNGRMIAEMMHARRLRGNPKDYVILVGPRLIDFAGTYEIQGMMQPKVVLVHKRELSRVVGEQASRRFWRRGTGRTCLNSTCP